MSRYLKKEDLYAAMANRIERLERELKSKDAEWMREHNLAMSILAERDRMKLALEKIIECDRWLSEDRRIERAVEIAREALK
jgi:hypothetical protein